MDYRFIFAFALLVAASLPAGARQPVSPEHDAPDPAEWLPQTWTVADDLPPGPVVGVAAAGESGMVVATRSGVTIFDGCRWQRIDAHLPLVHDSSPGKSGSIERLLVTPEGTVHVVLADGCLASRQNDARNRWVLSKPVGVAFDVKSSVAAAVSSACIAGDGAVWVGLANGAVIRWQKPHGGDSADAMRLATLLGPDAGLPSATPAFVTADRAGRLWVAHLGHLAMFEGDRFQSVPRVPLGNISLAPAHDGGLWIKAGAPLYHFDQEHGFVPRAERTIRNVRTLLEDSAGRLWMGTNQFGVRLLVGDTLMAIPTVGNAVTGIAEDSAGGVWVGTSDAVSRVTRSVAWVTTAPTTKPLDTFLEDGAGTAWFVTDQGELGMQARGRDGRPEDAQFLVPGKNAPDPFASCLAPAADGTVLVGFKRGKLARYTAAGVQPLPLPADDTLAAVIHAVLEAKDGSIWVAAAERLLRRTDGRWQRCGEAASVINRLAEDAEGRIWACTATGQIGRVDPAAPSLEFDVPPDFGGRGPITGLVPTADGSVWIASPYHGLIRWKSGAFTAVGTEHGLPTTEIHAMVADPSGKLWCVCRKRVFAASLDSLEAVADRRSPRVFCWDLTPSRGLDVLEAVGEPGRDAFLDASGRVRVALSNGMLVCDPSRLRAPTEPPRAVVKAVRVDGRLVDQPFPGRPLPVPPQAGSVEIECGEATFAWPTNTLVEHRLAGIDPDWMPPAASASIAYRRLPPGTHAFHLRTSSDAGTWVDAEPALTIDVEALLWDRPWFRAAMLAIFGGFAALLTAGVSALRGRSKMQRLRAQAAIDRERLRIAQDMHDEVGTSLTQIALLADLMQADRGAPANSDRLATVSDISRKTVASMEELVWAVTPANDTLPHLVGYIGPWVNQMLDRFGIECFVDAPAHVPPVLASAEFRRTVLLIVKEAVSNVIEHSQATRVRLDITCDAAGVRLVLADNGTGIDPGKRPGYGLSNMRQRAESIGGGCRIDGGPDGGTVISLDIPLTSMDCAAS